MKIQKEKINSDRRWKKTKKKTWGVMIRNEDNSKENREGKKVGHRRC